MDRPVVLHIRCSPTDLQFQSCRILLIYTLASPRADGVKCYDVQDTEVFASLLEKVENIKELNTSPLLLSSTAVDRYRLVIAEFSDGKMKAYNTIISYLDNFSVPIMCTDPHCKKDHRGNKSEDDSRRGGEIKSEPTEEQLQESKYLHEEGAKKIVENYITHISSRISAAGLVGIYNRVQKLSGEDPVPEELRREVVDYMRLVSYKCSLVPLRNPDDASKIATIIAIFEEAEIDDLKSALSQSISPSPVLLLGLSRIQRRVRNRECVMHYLAFFASLKFDEEDGLKGRDSMYV